MLAIIAYKNLFPRDFANLQLNQGFVYTLFNRKDEFIKSEITEIKKAIDEKQNRITFAQKEHLISMRELNAVFAENYSSFSVNSGKPATLLLVISCLRIMMRFLKIAG